MSGFEFVNMVDYGLKDERYATDLFSYCSHEVIAMKKHMGYMPGMGIYIYIYISQVPQRQNLSN